MDKHERARAAERLRANPDFQLFFKECRDEQVALFLTPATDEAALKDAHDMVRALHAIALKLNWSLDRKGQEKG